MGSWGINLSVGQTNRVNRKADLSEQFNKFLIIELHVNATNVYMYYIQSLRIKVLHK